VKKNIVIIILFLVSYSISQNILDSVDCYKAEKNIDKRVTVFIINDSLANDTLFLSGAVENQDFFVKLEEWIQKSDYPVVNKILQAPDTVNCSLQYAVVWLSVVSLRSRPTVYADIVTQAVMGTPLKVYLKDDDSYYVQTPDGYLGWLEGRRIVPLTKEEYDHFHDREEMAVYWEPTGWAYQEKKENSKPVTDLVILSTFRLIKKEKKWSEVEFYDGRRGYVLTKEIKTMEDWKKQKKPDGKKIISDAERFLGVPYFWGGLSGKMLDSSGLVQTVFRMNHIYLPRDASQQVFVGKDVPIDEELSALIKGDLLFFGYFDSLNQIERITHVGIYAGNLEYIHESVHVHYNSFDENSPIYNENAYKTLRAARRILEEE